MLAGCMGASFSACNDSDWESTSSKHVYVDGESPCLRVNPAAIINENLEFREGAIMDKSVSLKKYAETIQRQLGMTVADLMEAYDNGDVVLYNINASRGIWNLADPTKGASGWYYNNAGGVVSESDGVASVSLDKESKSLVVSVPEDTEAGLSLTTNLGFAVKNGYNFDQYVRLMFNISVTNPGLIMVNCTIPSGDYAAYLIDFNEYADQIEKALGVSVKDFVKMINEGEDIALYMVHDKVWDKESEYTANGLGYWLDADSKVKNWGEGCTLFAESNPEDGGIGIGRYPGIASGTTQSLDFVYVLKNDESKFIEFKVNATFE